MLASFTHVIVNPLHTSSHYRVKHRCSKVLHNAESCYLQ